LPRDAGGADPARARGTNGPAARILPQVVLLSYFRQDFFLQKAGVLIGERVVFEAAVTARFLALLIGRKSSRIDEDADRHGHIFFVNEIVKDDRHAKIALLVHISPSVLKDHDTSGLLRIVLSRHIDPIIANRAFENLASPLVLADLALRDIRLLLRIGAELIIHGG